LKKKNLVLTNCLGCGVKNYLLQASDQSYISILILHDVRHYK